MIRKCLFPAGGLGTRFLPVTKSLPKEMLPIVNTPLLQYGVEEALDAGLNYINIVTNKSKRAIEDYFDKNLEIETIVKNTNKEELLKSLDYLIKHCIFSYTQQSQAKGLGHAILTGESLIGNEPFGVLLADDLCVNQNKGVMNQLVEIYNHYQCSVVAIEEVAPQDVDKYGVIVGDALGDDIFRVKDMVEKPDVGSVSSNSAVIGRYILTPDIFDIIRKLPPGKNNEIQLTDALLVQAKQGQVVAYSFQGRRFDCGSVSGFLEANNYFFNSQNI